MRPDDEVTLLSFRVWSPNRRLSVVVRVSSHDYPRLAKGGGFKKRPVRRSDAEIDRLARRQAIDFFGRSHRHAHRLHVEPEDGPQTNEETKP